jgi:hypothetical protein
VTRAVLITIDATTELSRDRLALVIADEFDEHGYVVAESVTIHMDGEPAITYLLDDADPPPVEGVEK